MPLTKITGGEFDNTQGGLSVAGIITASSDLLVSGNLGVGTVSPSQKLEVSGTTRIGSTSSAVQYSTLSVIGDSAIIAAGPTLNLVGTDGLTRYGYLYHSGAGADLYLTNQQNGNLLFSTNNTERARLDSSGNLGVGTVATVSGCKLNVNTGINCNGLNVSGVGGFYNGSNKFGVDNNSGVTRFYSSGANSSTKGSYDFRITDSVGTLDTSAAVITNTGTALFGYTSSTVTTAGVIGAVGYICKQGVSNTPTGNIFNFFWSGSSLQAWIDTSNVGNVTLTSDYRIKKNIKTQVDEAIPRIKSLRPVTYERTEYKNLFCGDGVKREGFIAHEVAEIIPSGVEGEKDAENQIQSLNIDAIVSVLTKALQEAVVRIETLENEIQILKSK